MKNTILLLIFCLLAVLVFASACATTPSNASDGQGIQENVTKQGNYSDDAGTVLGTCTEIFAPSTSGPGGTFYTSFYDLSGNLVGSCSAYAGPGASGWKGGCDEDSVKNNVGTVIEEGTYAGRIAEKYKCVMD